jgi:hypothetical protein
MKRTFGKRLQWMTALLVIAALALPWTAFADNVMSQVNQVEAEGSNVFTAGQSISASYWINQNSGDGGDQQPGCNASDGSPAIVQIVAPAGLTATPATLTLSACGKENDQTVVFTSNTAGTYDVTTTVEDPSGDYNTNPSKFTLTVNAAAGGGDTTPVDTTAPVITPNVAGTAGNNGWYTATSP